MTDSNDNCSFPIPYWFKKRLQGLLFPGQCLDDIFNQISCLEFEESNEIKVSDGVWSSKTMTLQQNKPKTLDMFLSKVAKSEFSNFDSDDSVICSNDSSVSKHSSWTENLVKSHHGELIAKSTPLKENKKVHSKVHKTTGTVSSEMDDESTELIIKNSPASEDLFAEEVPTTSATWNTSNSLIISKKKKVEHSISDEEIIPSSQTYENVKRFSLGSLSAYSDSVNSNKSLQISNSSKKEPCKSPKKSNMKQNMSVSFNEQTLNKRGDYSSEEEQQPISHLDSIKNSMKSINEVLTKTAMLHEKFGFGDLTEDDEVYILQCPTEVDIMKLEGVTLNLNGISTVSFANEENKILDCFSLKGNSDRCLYIALPDTNKEEMKIGIYPLAGNVILSENFEIPYTATAPFKDECDLGNQSSICYNESELGNISETRDEKPRKKKKRNSDIYPLAGNVILSENFEIPYTATAPFKDECDLGNQSSICYNESELGNISETRDEKPRKKKKRNSDGSENDAVLTECFESLTDESPDKLVSKKKKKKKHRNTEDETWDKAGLNECFSQKATEIVLNQFMSKKKKKKHSNTESNGIDSSILDFNQFLNIKTEWEEPQTASESQETPSKSKKKKRKDMEGSRESIEEDRVPRKKKKEKHSHLDSQFMVSPSQDCEKYYS